MFVLFLGRLGTRVRAVCFFGGIFLFVVDYNLWPGYGFICNILI